jgi:hypothetical protein
MLLILTNNYGQKVNYRYYSKLYILQFYLDWQEFNAAS